MKGYVKEAKRGRWLKVRTEMEGQRYVEEWKLVYGGDWKGGGLLFRMVRDIG